MAEVWEIILSIIGAGVVGYAIRWLEERRRRTHEKETEYRKELKKHLPDLIEPLFKLLGDLWVSLIELMDWDADVVQLVRGRRLTKGLGEVKRSMQNLVKFVEEKETRLDMLLPHPLQSWQYLLIQDRIEDIVHDLKRDKVKFDLINDTIGAIVSMQNDLQKLVGFETKMRLESEYAFAKPLSRFEKIKERFGRL